MTRAVAFTERVVLAWLILLWVFYAFMVTPHREGLDWNLMPSLTDPYLGPSMVGDAGVPATGRTVSVWIALVMVTLHLWAFCDLGRRAAGHRSTGVLLCGGANAVLLAWSVLLLGIGHAAPPPLPGNLVVVGMFALWPWLAPLPPRAEASASST